MTTPRVLLCLVALNILAACGPLSPYETDPSIPGTAQEAVVHKESCRGAPYPIVLLHGMAGWDEIGPLNYFFNVAADLSARELDLSLNLVRALGGGYGAAGTTAAAPAAPAASDSATPPPALRNS